MYFKKNKINFINNLKYFKISAIILLILISFTLGAYAHKKHFFYTFIKPLIFQNVKFINKFIKGKIQDVDQIYLNINFENLKELNNRREVFIKTNSILSELNDWVDISIVYNNKQYESKIRFKGRDTETHLNPSMRNKNISYKVKIKKREKGNILGLREFNLMDLRRRGYILEWYARNFLKQEGLIYLEYKFVNLFINGENHGIYVIDENITEATLTRNKRRDNISIRLDNNFIRDSIDLSMTNPVNAAFDNSFVTTEIDTLNENIKKKETILKSSNKKIISKPDPERIKNYNIAYNLIDKFRKGLLKAEEVFDIDQLAKGFAASDILDGWHGIHWANMSFYLNPISLKLEPIFQDWYNEGYISSPNEVKQRHIRYLDVYNYGIFYKNIFLSEEFLKKYVYYLEVYSEDEYLKKFNFKIKNEFNKNLRKIYKSSPYYEFPHELFQTKIKKVKSFINYYDPIYLDLLYEQKKTNGSYNTILDVGNKHVLPIRVSKIEIEGYNGENFEKFIDINLKPRNLKMFSSLKFEKSPINYQTINFNSPDFKNFKSVKIHYNFSGSLRKLTKIISNPLESGDKINLKFDNFLVNNNNKDQDQNNLKFIELIKDEYVVKNGKWIISKDLIIPDSKKLIILPGTELILTNNAQIISKSPIIAKGTKENKILIKGLPFEQINNDQKNNIKYKNKNSGQCILIINAKETSIFENTEFDNLRNCDKDLIISEGSLNVYKSNIIMKNVVFKNNKSGDDGINFINSEFELKNIEFKNIYADGLDLDYSFGKIDNFSCTNCANDGIDISNTTLVLKNYKASQIQDKAISIGENSIINGTNLDITNSYVGIAIKDGSIAKINKINVRSTEYPITTYIKKDEFGPADLEISKINLKDNLNPILIEEGSKFKIDVNEYSHELRKDLFTILYPDAKISNTQ